MREPGTTSCPASQATSGSLQDIGKHIPAYISLVFSPI